MLKVLSPQLKNRVHRFEIGIKNKNNRQKMIKQKLKKIEKEKLLLVEGKDEISFFEVLLKKMEIEQDIQIIECGGKDQFEQQLPVVMNAPGFDNVISMAVIQDADEYPHDALKRIQKVLENNNLNPPEKNRFVPRNSTTRRIFN